MLSDMERFDRNVPYNSLPPLTPDMAAFSDVSVLEKLAESSRALAELKGMATTLPNQSIFVNTLSLREAKASAAIENIFTTDDDLYRAIPWQNDRGIDGPAKEILHYREAIWKGYANVRSRGRLNMDDVVDIYRIVKEAHDGIRPYQADVVIRKRGSDTLGGSVAYTPPRGKGVVEDKLAALIAFVNDDEQNPVDPLLKMAAAHYQFEAIHPFRDGNGRTGRILSLLILIQKGLLDLPILYLSSYIIKNKDEYYYRLSSVTGGGDWASWLLFMLETVRQTAIYTLEKVKDMLRLMQSVGSELSSALPNFRKDLIPKLFEQPYIRPKSLLGPSVKSLNTAKKYLSQLEGIGLLSHEAIGRETVYLNVSLLNLLSE